MVTISYLKTNFSNIGIRQYFQKDYFQNNLFYSFTPLLTRSSHFLQPHLTFKLANSEYILTHDFDLYQSTIEVSNLFCAFLLSGQMHLFSFLLDIPYIYMNTIQHYLITLALFFFKVSSNHEVQYLLTGISHVLLRLPFIRR